MLRTPRPGPAPAPEERPRASLDGLRHRQRLYASLASFTEQLLARATRDFAGTREAEVLERYRQGLEDLAAFYTEVVAIGEDAFARGQELPYTEAVDDRMVELELQNLRIRRTLWQLRRAAAID